jgi:hypothetical protein
VQSLRAELAWSLEAPRIARALVGTWLEAAGCDEPVAADLVLATSELVTWAVNGCPADPTLECSFDTEGVRIAVGSAPMLDGPYDEWSDYGAMVMWAICEAWGRVDENQSTHLWARLRPAP